MRDPGSLSVFTTAAGWRAVVVVLVTALALTAPPLGRTQNGAQLLNSERIEARFGSYGIDVLESDGHLRVSDLYSVDQATGARTTRTFAIVELPADIRAELGAEHAAVLAGGSIGATFRASGWTVIKTNLLFAEVASTAKLAALMQLARPAALAVHVYALDVERDGLRLPYALIAEVHHPEYLDLETVTAIYAGDPEGSATERLPGFLEILEAKIR